MIVETARERLETIAQELNELLELDTHEMFHGLLTYGDTLPPLAVEEHISENAVPGCVSTAYICLSEKEGKVHMRGYSDAMVVRALMGVLAFAFSVLSPAELASSGRHLVKLFTNTIKLETMLSPTRANAFANIVEHIMRQVESL